MRWTLAVDGDLYERLFGHYIAGTFPGYEAFWAEFVVPLTKRPHGIGLRDRVPLLLRQMAAAHYSIFWHLVCAHRLLGLAATPTEDALDVPASGAELLFDSVILHLGMAADMTERFLFLWARIADPCPGKELPPWATALEPKAAGEMTERHVRGRGYKHDLAQFRRHGRPVTLMLHKRADAIRQFLGRNEATDAYNAFRSITGKSRGYRNVVAHEPVRARARQAGVLLVLKPGKVEEVGNWEAARDSAPGDWVSALELAMGFLEQLERALNDLWQSMAPLCRPIWTRAARDEGQLVVRLLAESSDSDPVVSAYARQRLEELQGDPSSFQYQAGSASVWPLPPGPPPSILDTGDEEGMGSDAATDGRDDRTTDVH